MYLLYTTIKTLLIIFFVLNLTVSSASAQNRFEDPEISSVFRNIAELTDSTMIQFILDDFLIAEDISEIEKIEIVDVTNVGFGTNDLLIIHPSREIYILDAPQSAELLQHMLSWRIIDQRIDAESSLRYDFFDPGVDHNQSLEGDVDQQIEWVQNALIFDILESLDRNYQDMPISLRFERDNEGFTFQMWNYNINAFAYTPRPSSIADTVFVDQIVEREVFVESEPEFILTDEVERNWTSGLSVSLLTSYLNNDVFKTNYSNGIGAQIQFDHQRNWMLYRVGTGFIYHSVRQENPLFNEQRQATNLFMLGMIGVKWNSSPILPLYVGIGGRASSYFYLEDWSTSRSQSFSALYSELGIDFFGVTVFGRYGLLTRPKNQSIIEAGFSLKFF